MAGAQPSADGQGSHAGKARLIEAVKTPLGLLAMVALILEGIVGALIVRSEGNDRTYLVIGAVAGLLLLVCTACVLSIAEHVGKRVGLAIALLVTGAALFAYAQVRIERPFFPAWDAFVSAPLTSLASEDEYQVQRKRVLELMAAVREHTDLKKLYYAAEHRETTHGTTTADLSWKIDYPALRDSRWFILVYPRKVHSSVLVEAGVAIALNKPSIYFVRSRHDLPFLLRNAPNSTIYEVPDPSSFEVARFVSLIEKDGKAFFRR